MFFFELIRSPLDFLIFIVAILMVLSIHECSHAWMANYLGDPTARLGGRITLNPRAHIDISGAIFFLLFGFGWGKPVPVNPVNFKHPRRDEALTALAGPLSNLITAMVFAIPIRYFSENGAPENFGLTLLAFLSLAVFHLSIVLFIFNLLPIPPLDGSKILSLLVPDRHYHNYVYWMHKNVRYFMIFIFVDVFALRMIFGFSVVGTVIGFLYNVVSSLILLGT